MLNELAVSAAGFLESYGLTAIFLLVLVKQVGVPVPIPTDLIMLAAAAQIAAGKLDLWQAFGSLLVAMVIGGCVQYSLAHGLGRPFLFRFGPYVGLTPERLERAMEFVRKGGAAAVGLSLLTPGLRIATVPACGLARLPYPSFLIGFVAGSAAFLAMHFAIGYVGGSVIAAATGAGSWALLGLLAVSAVAGAAIWMAVRRRAARDGQEGPSSGLDGLGDWADASCPVCLAIGAVQQSRQRPFAASRQISAGFQGPGARS